MQLLWQQVQDGVITIQQALAAIQAGPVVSVMGRSGVVTGLVEANAPGRGKADLMANAPLGQPTIYESTTGAGADWPTADGVVSWSVYTTGIAGRKTQRAVQMFAGILQGWVFERQLHDATWGRWIRILTDGAPIERFVAEAVSAAWTPDLTKGSFFWVEPTSNITITPPTPRAGGDPITLRLVQRGSYSFAFGANVRQSPGVTFPAPAAGEMLTVTLLPFFGTQNLWTLHTSGKHAA